MRARVVVMVSLLYLISLFVLTFNLTDNKMFNLATKFF